MVTNGETTVNHELFSDRTVQKMENVTPPFESANNSTLPIDNLTCKN